MLKSGSLPLRQVLWSPSMLIFLRDSEHLPRSTYFLSSRHSKFWVFLPLRIREISLSHFETIKARRSQCIVCWAVQTYAPCGYCLAITMGLRVFGTGPSSDGRQPLSGLCHLCS